MRYLNIYPLLILVVASGCVNPTRINVTPTTEAPTKIVTTSQPQSQGKYSSPTPSLTPAPGLISGCGLQLITDKVSFGGISISPDGDLIIFTSGSGQIPYLSMIQSDGTGYSQLAKTTPFAADPVWSPDGQNIAFTKFSQREGGELFPDIYLRSLQNPDGLRVTNNPTFTYDWISEIIWSSDGKRIAFTGYNPHKEKSDIYIVNADGSGLQRLTYPPNQHYAPRWSPDGKKLAYISYSFSGINDRINHLTLFNLTNGSSEVLSSAPSLAYVNWSLNGDRLLYHSKLTGNNNIYQYILSSGEEIDLISGASSDMHPSFSPDGLKILFVSDIEGKDDLYLFDVFDETIYRIAENYTDDYISNPHWAPDGTKAYFFLSNYLEETNVLYSVDIVDSCEH